MKPKFTPKPAVRAGIVSSVLCAGVAAPMQASAVPFVGAAACDNTCMPSYTTNGTGAAQTTVPGQVVSQSDSVSQASASAHFGDLGGSITAAPGAVAGVTASWDDRFTINGTPGTAGTTATATLNSILNGSVTIGANAGYVSLDVFSPSSSVINDTVNYETPGPITPIQRADHGTLLFTYGQPIDIRADITVATVTANIGGSGSTSVDVSNGFQISGITLPKGATLTSLSGTQYPVSTVPLPAAAWLFGSGLVGLVGAGRRKRSTRTF